MAVSGPGSGTCRQGAKGHHFSERELGQEKYHVYYPLHVRKMYGICYANHTFKAFTFLCQ